MIAGASSRLIVLTFAACVLAGACSRNESSEAGPKTGEFHVRSLAKSDIGQVMEVHVGEVREQLRILMFKLYKRNPRELRKVPGATADGNATRLFTRTTEWHFPELLNVTGVNAIHLSLTQDFEGDRVFAFIAGLASMLMAAYEYKTEFYILDTVDPQNLYNSARNLEIAAWKLEHNLDAGGKPYIYSVSLGEEPENLSYERLFGKMIALQDTMAIIIADRSNRTIRKVVQNVATAMFLPIL